MNEPQLSARVSSDRKLLPAVLLSGGLVLTSVVTGSQTGSFLGCVVLVGALLHASRPLVRPLAIPVGR